MKRIAWICVLLAALSSPVSAQQAAPPAAPAPPDKTLKLEGLRLDVKNRRITIDAEVTAPTTALEFLLVRSGAKEYESVLRSKVKGSDLHAALLALGLMPGKPARWIDQDQGDPRFAPPEGPAVSISLRWKDKQDKVHEQPASSWMAPAGRKKVNMPDRWVFIGSQFLPDGRYWADVDGEIISVSNFASAVLDVPFESSNKEALMDFVSNAKAMPPAGTKVEMIIEPLAGAENSPHARVMIEIDPFGRLRLDGRPILLSDVREWAEQFIAKYPKGFVQIRAAGKAIVHDVEQVRMELRLGGAWETEIIRLPAEDAVLPRTPDQLQRQLKWWDNQFANAQDLIRDPAEDAQAVLQQIQRDLQVLQATQGLWEQYAKNLRQKMETYKASTQPAGTKTQDKPSGP